MRSLLLCWLGCAAAAFVPPTARARGAVAGTRCSSPLMIIDQMKAAAKQAENAAAEAIVAQKVAEKLARATEKYDIPDQYVNVMSGFFTSYMTEIYKSGKDMDTYEAFLTELFKKVLELAKEPHVFDPYHRSMREPYDYYELGNNFAGGVINKDLSAVVGTERLAEIQERVAAGDNVVLLSNHQSEADPQIFSVLLDEEYPGFAEKAIFVAGDRVTTDLLAQPFSMGRNLLCIFSKKHVDNPPELKSQKTKHNRNVMKQMQNLFKEGGKVIWVAPSGGRDRTDDDGNYVVAPFDAKSVEMFRLMADKAARTTHFYPVSMLTYSVCPPPVAVGGAIGEERTVKWSPAGLHFAPSIDLEAFAQGCVVEGTFPEGCTDAESRGILRDKLSEHVHGIVSKNYEGLTEALKEHL